MSSSVCQGLQSCLEPRILEPRVLIQNLAPPNSTLFHSIPWTQKPNMSQPQHDQNEIVHNDNNKKNIIINNHYCSFIDSQHESNKDAKSVWNSIQALTNTCENFKQVTDAGQAYVHPLVKRSSSTLSTKSLEMCTESLGSETGSSIGESIDCFLTPLPERSNSERPQRSRQREFPKKMDRNASFPPPLTSISGSDGVKMRTHREGGRLVLKAVSVPSSSSYFQTERANGRLRLSLLKDTSEKCFNAFEEKVPNNVIDDEVGQELENTDDKELQSKEAEDDAKSTYLGEDDLEVNGENTGYEVGVGEFPRPSRCKEEGTRNKGIPNWGPFRVAIFLKS